MSMSIMKYLKISIILISLSVMCLGVYAQDLAHIELDAKQTGGTISPLLFSHNLEVTRRGIWRGLSAEMVANRKFAASEKGFPKRWNVLDSTDQVIIDDKVAYAGTQSLRIEVTREGTSCGIYQVQETLAFQKDTKYVLRLWLKTDTDRTVKAKIGDATGDQILFEKTWPIKPGSWQLVSDEITASAASENSRLEISSQAAGVFWIGAVSVQPANAFHGMRRDVIALLKQIKPGSLRYPGGCYAEFYHWQEGLLPVDQRPPIGPMELTFVLPDSDNYDSQEIGIDEFIALCREVGCEPAVTMRLCENTSEDAAAWVEYCNGSPDTKWGNIRAQRGHTEPYRVKCWFVGNELYYFGRGGLKNADAAARQTQLFASAMKKADPAILLVGCTYAGNKDWNKSLIGQADGLLDLFSVHNYLLDQFKGDLPGIAKASTKILRPSLQNARDAFRQDVQKDRPIGIAFDEWNLMWGLQSSVEMGLYTAGTLNLLCREAAQLEIERAYFFMPVNEGAIKVTPLGASLDTAGEVFDLFKVHQGNRLLKTPEIQADADLDLCASISPEAGNVYVTIVNRCTSGDRIVELELRNFAGNVDPAVTFLIPQALSEDAKEFRKLNEKLEMLDNKRVVLHIAPCSIARVNFGGMQ